MGCKPIKETHEGGNLWPQTSSRMASTRIGLHLNAPSSAARGRVSQQRHLSDSARSRWDDERPRGGDQHQSTRRVYNRGKHRCGHRRRTRMAGRNWRDHHSWHWTDRGRRPGRRGSCRGGRCRSDRRTRGRPDRRRHSGDRSQEICGTIREGAYSFPCTATIANGRSGRKKFSRPPVAETSSKHQKRALITSRKSLLPLSGAARNG